MKLTNIIKVAIMAAKWSVSTSKLLAPTDLDPTKDIPKRFHSDNPVFIENLTGGFHVLVILHFGLKLT